MLLGRHGPNWAHISLVPISFERFFIQMLGTPDPSFTKSGGHSWTLDSTGFLWSFASVGTRSITLLALSSEHVNSNRADFSAKWFVQFLFLPSLYSTSWAAFYLLKVTVGHECPSLATLLCIGCVREVNKDFLCRSTIASLSGEGHYIFFKELEYCAKFAKPGGNWGLSDMPASDQDSKIRQREMANLIAVPLSTPLQPSKIRSGSFIPTTTSVHFQVSRRNLWPISFFNTVTRWFQKVHLDPDTKPPLPFGTLTKPSLPREHHYWGLYTCSVHRHSSESLPMVNGISV